MIRSCLIVSSLAFLLWLVPAYIAPGGEALKSGLQPGEKITTIFEPLNVTGEHAGEPYCLICENGLSPVAMIFAREASTPLLELLAKIDETTAKNRNSEMGSFAVFLNKQEGLKSQLQAAAQKRNFKHIILAIDDPTGPEGFKVSSDADITVVLYREHLVKANHSFRKGELTPAAIDKIVADLPKILSKP
jgi:hypothetical protein